jgi:ABC-type polysaccharide/polyol phosphate export permease
MGSYLAAVWKCRYFWLSLVKNDLRTRYQRSVLGLGWSLVQPLAMTVVICVAFKVIMRISNDPYFPVHVLAGLTCWKFIVECTTNGCRAFLNGEAYIRQYPAPMFIYPLRTVLGCLIHFLLGMLVLLAVSVYYIDYSVGHAVTALAALIPAIALLFLLGLSLAVLASFVNVYFHDTQHLCDVGFQMLFYLTPIMYDSSFYGDRGRLKVVINFNPFVPFLDLIREPILHGRIASAETFAMAGLLVLVIGSFSMFLLNRLQKVVIFRL